MKLYYAPGACSLAVHIAAIEAGLGLELELVDLREHRIAGSGRPFAEVNPKNSVPALELDDGAVLTEAAAILQWVGEEAGQPALLGGDDRLARFRVREWLNFVATEIHKGLGPLWQPQPDEVRKSVVERFAGRLALVEKQLAAGPFLTGASFTVADAYLFTVLNWAPMLGIGLDAFPAVQRYAAEVARRDAVQRALRREGLLG